LKVSVYIATTVDGFIARPNGDISWLNGIGETEDHGFASFIESVDVMVMGRKTFDQVLTFDEWGYADTRVIVLSRGSVDIPEHLSNSVESSSSAPRNLIERFSEEGRRHVYVDGGMTIQSFLNEGLVTNLELFRIPVLIGEGISLFGPLDQDTQLRLIESEPFPSGIVRSSYEILATHA
jgi:dihydrofolate reductase